MSMSNDGSTFVVSGVRNDVGGSRTDAGHVRVYTLDPTVHRYLQIGSDLDGKASYDVFGGDVSISGDGHTLAIGAEFLMIPILRPWPMPDR